MKALGIDFGLKNIGIAISYHGKDAIPYSVVPAKPINKAIAVIEQIAEENDIDTIVLGIPYSMNGSRSQQTELALNFEKLLRKRMSASIIKVDERLTTRQAEDLLLQYSSGRQKKKKDIDKYSAALILQSYLDTIKG